MKNNYLILAMFLFGFCNPKKIEEVGFKNEKIIKNELIIIFNRYEESTALLNLAVEPGKSLYYKRKNFEPPFDDPNLHINVYLNNGKKNILRKNLDKMNVWFDSEMGYMDWFRLDFEKYYIIYQDEYLVKSSLDPEYSFSAYEVKIHTGGVE